MKVLFLGPLRDLAGEDARYLPAPLTWPALLEQVDAGIAAELQEARVHVACGGEVLGNKTALLAHDGDEVALLPPVSGGGAR